MPESFKVWTDGLDPPQSEIQCPNCGTKGLRVNREMCLECGVVFRVMAEKQREQVNVGKELAKIALWLCGDNSLDDSITALPNVLARARACGLLED